jgi:zinc transport system permease protein
MDIFSYSFFQYALLGSLFTAMTCGMTGAYVAARRLLFISGGITHASFGGVGLGFFLGVNPVLTAVVFAAGSALGVEWLSRSQQMREDSAIAAVWSLGMALGVIFVFVTPGYAPNVSMYLFGNILTVSSADLVWMGALAVVLALLFGLFGREMSYVAFDRDFAMTQGLPVRLIEYGMMLMIAFTIVLSIRMVGIMLLLSLLTLPAAIVNLFTASFGKIVGWSMVVGFLACLAGLAGSYFLDVPSGAFIVVVLTALFFAGRLAKR